ncbi:MAG: hypothetical protein DLM70_02880 [Chloroflexi bacterium]|nr:MAG: hypothetical protein DLM70_02880 [Chloroflexota bacterium]
MKMFLLAAAMLLMPVSTSARASHRVTVTAFPITIIDDLGDHVRLERAPKRILTLDASDTETLFALGLEKRLVGDGSKYSEGATGISRDFRYPSEWPSTAGRDYPIRAKRLTHIEGGYGTIPFDLETIEKLQPDVIFSLNSDHPALQKMRDLGLKVIVNNPGNLHGVLKDVALAGRATGTAQRASVVLATMNRQLAAVRSRVARLRARPRVYYEIDATNPLEPFTAGPGTFVDDAIHLAGGRNVADAVRTCSGTGCYPQLTLESLVRFDPQVIVLADAPYGTTTASVEARSGWNTMAAVRGGKIYPINPDLLSRPGPRVMVGLQALMRLIHRQTPSRPSSSLVSGPHGRATVLPPFDRSPNDQPKVSENRWIATKSFDGPVCYVRRGRQATTSFGPRPA